MTVASPTAVGASRPAAEPGAGFPLAVLVMDAAGRTSSANIAWADMTGLASEDSRGMGWLKAVDPRDAETLLGLLTRADRTGSRSTDCRLRAGGRTRWSRWWWSHRSNDLIACIADIDGAGAEAPLSRCASQDPLTGLANRDRFVEQLGQNLRGTARSGRQAAVVTFDLDDFARVNNLHGRVHGDMCLRTIGAHIRKSTREEDLAGRTGGDEFAVLCLLEKNGDVRILVDRVRRAVRIATMDVNGGHPIDATAAVAYATSPYEDAEALLTRSEQAIYSAMTSRSREGRHGPG